MINKIFAKITSLGNSHTRKIAIGSICNNIVLNLSFNYNNKKSYQPARTKNYSQQQKNPRHNNRYKETPSLSFILNRYKQDNEKFPFIIQQILPFCKSIVQYYKKQRHFQYIRQTTTLKNILQQLSRLQMGNASLEDYFAMVDFLCMIKKIKTIQKSNIQTVQNLILLKLSPYISKFETISLQTKIKLYSSLCDLNYAEIKSICDFLSRDLKQLGSNNSLDMKYIMIILQLFSTKQVLRTSQKQMFRQIIGLIHTKIQHFDQISLLKLSNALTSDSFLLMTTETQILSVYDKISNQLQQFIEEGLKQQSLDFILSLQCEGGKLLHQFYELIYQMLKQKIQQDKYHPKLLQYLSAVTYKIKGKIYSPTEVAQIILYIERFGLGINQSNDKLKQGLPKYNTRSKQKSIQIIILQLIRSGFFDQNITIIDKLINSSYFECYWSFPYEYSRRGAVFPLQRLLAKIKPFSLVFKQDINYIKMAVTISIQSKLHNNSKLLQYQKQIKMHVNSFSLDLSYVEWFIKQQWSNSEIMRIFHQNYCTEFEDRVEKDAEVLLFSKEEKKNLKYWIYMMTVWSVDNYRKNLYQSMSTKTIRDIIKRELHNFSPQINIKKFLLFVLTDKRKKFPNRFDSALNFDIVELLLIYSKQLEITDIQSIKMYLNLLNYFLVDSSNWKQNQIFQILIIKLINIRSTKVHNQPIYQKFLQNLEKYVLVNITNNQFTTFVHKIINNIKLKQKRE